MNLKKGCANLRQREIGINSIHLKNLSMALIAEAAELVEHFQWITEAQSANLKPEKLAEFPNGARCLFRLNPGGTRLGKIVLVQHRDIHDPDTGAQYTVKVYESEKIATDDGGWRHARIRLRPDTDAQGYEAIVFDAESVAELKVVAELVAVLG